MHAGGGPGGTGRLGGEGDGTRERAGAVTEGGEAGGNGGHSGGPERATPTGSSTPLPPEAVVNVENDSETTPDWQTTDSDQLFASPRGGQSTEQGRRRVRSARKKKPNNSLADRIENRLFGDSRQQGGNGRSPGRKSSGAGHEEWREWRWGPGGGQSQRSRLTPPRYVPPQKGGRVLPRGWRRSEWGRRAWPKRRERGSLTDGGRTAAGRPTVPGIGGETARRRTATGTRRTKWKTTDSGTDSVERSLPENGGSRRPPSCINGAAKGTIC